MQKMSNKALLTDLYQLTMDAAYYDNEKADEKATYELFIRRLPSDWGYFIAAGINEAIRTICETRFTQEDIEYLNQIGVFKEDYLEQLSSYRFTGDIHALREGTPFTAMTPILRVTAKRCQAQLAETILLNIVNYQTMIASKASRIVNAATPATVIDFGLRRAHGEDAGVKGARAAYIAGATATSNVEAARRYGIPVSGTMAHSYIMSYKDEATAYRSYAKTFPHNTVLLIDTYDTLEGANLAVKVAKEMEQKGNKLQGVRLDSGNMKNLAITVREILEKADLDYVKIILSSDLNEYKIKEYTDNKTPVDVYGVGTEMITAKPVAALSGVYKLVHDNTGPRIKLSESKQTYPGIKQVYRIQEDEEYIYDMLELEDKPHPGEPLLIPAAVNGKIVRKPEPIDMIREHCLECVKKLPAASRNVVAEPYKLKIGPELKNLTDKLLREHSNGEEKQ